MSGFKVESAEEVAPAIEKANGIDDRPVVIDFRTDAFEKVYPMVPAGASNDDIIVGPAAASRGTRSAVMAAARPRHHIVTAMVENKAGVLARVASLFSRRGFNIFSLAVAPTDDERFSRITIVVDVESAPLEQIVQAARQAHQRGVDHRARPRRGRRARAAPRDRGRRRRRATGGSVTGLIDSFGAEIVDGGR